MCSGKRALRGTIGRRDMIRNVETKGVGERADGSRWIPSSATQGQPLTGAGSVCLVSVRGEDSVEGKKPMGHGRVGVQQRMFDADG